MAMSPIIERAGILIVDDRPERVLALSTALEELGQDILTAYSGRDALRLILQRDFAVILLDVNMPGMDGFETASIIRQRKQSQKTPIIFITAFGDEIQAVRGYTLGAVDYILAPVTPEVLRSKVGAFVDMYLMNAQLRRQAETLHHRAEQLRKLAAASVAISAARSLESIVQTITDAARDMVGAHQAVTLFSGQHAVVTSASNTIAATSFSDKHERWRERPLKLVGLADTYLSQGQAATRLTKPELQKHPDWRVISQLELPAVSTGILAVPLHDRDGRSLGVIYLADRDGGPFSADDEAVVVQLAQMGSITIENAIYADERESNRLKDEFLATLSHELRTPLNAMVGWTDLLGFETLTPEVSHGLKVIRRNIDAQTKLVDDLLDVSRITTGKFRVTKKPLSLVSVIEQAVEALRPMAAEKHIAIEVATQPIPPVNGDADRLQQVVWNLLNNAVKFTPESGTINVEVTLLRADTAGSDAAEPFAEVRVTDSGQGIDPVFLPFIFDRFRQADSSTTRRHRGLGIGLALVRHIVELHGGTVSAASPGRDLGSTFAIRLPIAQLAPTEPSVPKLEGELQTAELPLSFSPAGEQRAAVETGGTDADPSGESSPSDSLSIDADSTQATPANAESTVLSGLRILLVEDEQDARLVLCELLRRAGAAVIPASSAEEAMEYFDKDATDIIVSDIAMPGEDGHSFVRRIRQRHPSLGGSVPCIAVTAFAREEDRAKAMAAGFNAHLSKPVSPSSLISALSTIRPTATSLSAG